MDKMKKRFSSLELALMKYIPVCFIISFIGIRLITKMSQLCEQQYRSLHHVSAIDINNGRVVWRFESGSRIIYWLLCNMQYILIPLLVIACVCAAGYFFYRNELKKPIDSLMTAAEKISHNELDFTIDYSKENEMGTLCRAFDDMRRKINDSNMELWHSLEERKRLSSAFSHDLRTPLTVLRGYVEFMQKYEDRITPEKQAEILEKMNSQILRLENYTQKMNSVQKLEDVVPEIKAVSLAELTSQIESSGRLLCEDMKYHFSGPDSDMEVYTDPEIIMQVCENLVSNALRYTDDSIAVKADISGDMLSICVSDNGKGFTAEAAANAANPFYRDDKDSSVHFGLGLYICRVLCAKCGGTLKIGNNEFGGGAVTAKFRINR